MISTQTAAAAATPVPAGGCGGLCSLLQDHQIEEEGGRRRHHDMVIEVLTNLDLEGLSWLLGELESAGELDGPAIYPGQLAELAGQHNFPEPVYAERVCASLARAYRRTP